MNRKGILLILVTVLLVCGAQGISEAAEKIYWTDTNTDKIQRANLDGSNIEDLVTGLSSPEGIALDVARGKMYWIEDGTNKIQRANLDGSNIEDLVTQGLERPESIALDVARGKMYWTDYGTDKIQRANLDGSNIEDLITQGLSGPDGIALDVTGGKIYWTDWDTDKIQRANLDGSNIEDLVTQGLSDPEGIALDVTGGKIYWTDYGTDKIQRANLDGSNIEDLVTQGLSGPDAIALDVAGGKMYWTDIGTDKIQRANLDGSNIEDLVTQGLERPDSIALDVPAAGVQLPSDDHSNTRDAATLFPLDSSRAGEIEIYYDVDYFRVDVSGVGVLAVYTTGSLDAVGELQDSSGAILASDDDGGNGVNFHIERFVGPGTYYVKVANYDGDTGNYAVHARSASSLVQERGLSIYWTDYETDKIQRTNLDGTNIQDLVTDGLNNPYSIALDVAGGKMYWTDIGTDKIQRANLDGSGVEDLVTSGLGDPYNIALDVIGGKMYWTDFGTGKIQRANLDGSGVQDLVTASLNRPFAIALDVIGGKMYWTDIGTSKIQRANLDGSGVQDLVTTSLSRPYGIALDVAGGKMYWTDNGTGKIQRANLDGSGVEDLVTSLRNPVSLDVAGGKMYWTSSVTGKIQRANLDGSGVEDFVATGLSRPFGIALGISVDSVQRSSDDHSDTREAATLLPLDSSRTGRLKTGDDVDYFRVEVSRTGELIVYTTSSLDTIGRLQDSSGSTLTTNDDRGSGANFHIERFVHPGTYYVKVEGYDRDIGNYSVHARFVLILTDVNGDGLVNVLDLVIVATNFGRVNATPAQGDVKVDGVVDREDIIAVLDALEGAAAPAAYSRAGSKLTAETLQRWIDRAKQLNIMDADFQRGIAILEELLATLIEIEAVPAETALLPNYPNPFNPETWIPYHLAHAADVTLTIYDINGAVVRQLDLGHQVAAVYESRSKAVYWDGRNELGEQVASSVYFYHLSAGDFSATRKMIILK